MTPPDSGEREVCPVDLAEMRRFWSSAVAAGSETALEVMRLVAEVELGRRDGVTISPFLTQRILAALENVTEYLDVDVGAVRDLVSELRAAVERKP